MRRVLVSWLVLLGAACVYNLDRPDLSRPEQTVARDGPADAPVPLPERSDLPGAGHDTKKVDAPRLDVKAPPKQDSSATPADRGPPDKPPKPDAGCGPVKCWHPTLGCIDGSLSSQCGSSVPCADCSSRSEECQYSSGPGYACAPCTGCVQNTGPCVPAASVNIPSCGLGGVACENCNNRGTNYLCVSGKCVPPDGGP